MKKILLFASALAGLFLAASCQQENLEPEQMAGTVKFTVEAPGAMATKTIADGMNVDEVHYEVYKNVEGVDHALLDPDSEPMAKGVVAMENKKANITLDLLQDQEYTVIFWAQVEGAGHYDTSDLRCVAFEGEVDANDESRAAFFKRFDFDTYEHKDYANIILRRPFAQLNLLTTMESLKPVSTGQTSGYEIDAKESEIIVSGLATSFNTVDGVGIAYDQPLTFAMAATPEEQGQATLKVNGKDYHYVSMNYMFVPVDAEDGSATVELKYEIVTDKGSIKHEIVNVPIRENYRTNVIGNLFTKESKFEIIVDAEFDGQNLVDVWDGREVSEPAIVEGKYVISTAAELAWLAAAVNGTLPPVAVNGVAQPTPKPQKFNGKTFMLLEDINLDNPSIKLPNVTWTPIGATGKFEGTFDGNGKTIYGLKVVAEGKASAGLFANAKYVKNVTVDGAQITGQYKTGVIVGDGLCSRIDNCHVINSTVTVTPYNKDEANNVGGIVGYLSAENEAWVKNCTVENTRISAYRKVGGIAGTANQAAVVTGNIVKNSFVIADQTPEYKEDKVADLGAIVGYVHAKATVAENTAENVELTHKVNSVEELNNAAEGAFVTLGAGEYNLTKDVTVKEKPVQVKEGAVVINGTDYTITAGSTGDYAFITDGANSSLVIDAKVASLGGGLAADNGAKIEFNGQGVDISKYTKSSPARYNIYASRGGEIVINSGTFKFNSTNNTRRSYVCVENGGKVIINGGTFGKASTRSGYTGIRVIDDQSEVIVKGGTFGFDPSEWVAAGYTAEKDDATQTWTVVPLTNDNLKDAVAVAGATVKVAAGEYAFPKTIAEGVNIVCEPGTVFTGSANLNIKTASVEGATFKNENGSVVNSGSISGTYKNCVFEGKNAFRYGYAGESLVFEDCTFRETADEWVFHFDGASTGVTNASIICRRCTFDGDRVAIAGAVKSLVMEDCDFINGSYFNSYCNSEYTGCDFNTSVRPLAAHHKYTDCTIKGSALSVSNLKLFKGYDCTLNIDGVAYTYDADGDGLVKNAEGAVVAWHRGILADALNAADADMTIVLLNDIYGDVTVAQKADVKIVIDGNGKNYDGMITVDGKSATYTTAGLTVKNLTFNASSIAGDACIRLGDGTNATRYTCNVSVEGCTFEVPGAVGVKSYTGGDKNLKLSGCTATAAAHSLLQVAGVDEVLVEGCTINSKNGMNFNNSVNVTINECNADVKGYAARFGAGSAADTAVETYAITNSTLKSACEDGDAVIILRGTAANSTLTLTNTTLVGDNEIANNTNAQVIR